MSLRLRVRLCWFFVFVGWWLLWVTCVLRGDSFAGQMGKRQRDGRLTAGEAQKHTRTEGYRKDVQLIETGAVLVANQGAVPLLDALLFPLKRGLGLIALTFDEAFRLRCWHKKQTKNAHDARNETTKSKCLKSSWSKVYLPNYVRTFGSWYI